MPKLKKLHWFRCSFLLDPHQFRALHWFDWRLSSKILTNLLDSHSISCMKSLLYQLALYTFLRPWGHLHFLHFFYLRQFDHEIPWAVRLIIVLDTAWADLLSHFVSLEGVFIELFYCMLRIVKSVLLGVTRVDSIIIPTVVCYLWDYKMLPKPYWVESRLMDHLRLAEIRIFSHLDDRCSKSFFRMA